MNWLGFTELNYTERIEEIKRIASTNEAELSKISEYSSLYLIKGKLEDMLVVTIWIEEIEADKYRFVTLSPDNFYG
ncbi:MAG: hypothetical protein C4308_01900 [Chitinophagaceae bacterium]